MARVGCSAIEVARPPMQAVGARARAHERRGSPLARPRQVRPRITQAEHPAVHRWDPLPLQAHAVRSRTRGSGSLPWAARCLRCGLQVSGTARWMSQLHTSCEHAVRATKGAHDLVATPDGYACRRCALPVRADRRHAAAQAQCPVPVVDPADDGFDAAYRHERARLQALITWARPPDPAVPSAPRVEPVRPAPAPPPGFLPGYRGHHLLQPTGTGSPLCLKCGVLARSAAVRHGPCHPVVPYPTSAVHALRSGFYDAALRRGPVWAYHRAESVGWRPLPAAPDPGG